MKTSYLRITDIEHDILADAAALYGELNNTRKSMDHFIKTAALKSALALPGLAKKYPDYKVLAPVVSRKPSWARRVNGVSLSNRTVTCLLKAGFNSRLQLRKAWERGYEFRKLPNMGKKCTAELREWLDA